LKSDRKPKRRQKKTTDTIWGVHPVMALLTHAPGRVESITVHKGNSPRLQALIALAEERGVPVRRTDTPFAGEAGRQNHQGVFAVARPPATLTLHELLNAIDIRRAPLLVALDGIVDPHNLGSIIRSAAAAGARGIIFPKDRAAPLSGTVAKVSVGAVNTMPLCRVTNMSNALADLKKHGFWIYGADGQATATIYQTDLTGPACLVIGGEHKGIRPLVKKHCDALISIPMRSGLDSLNAAVAAAVILFEAARQRQAAANP